MLNIKNKKLHSKSLALSFILICSFVVFIGVSRVSLAESISQSYGEAGTLESGMIVQLVPKNTSEVETASYNNMNYVFGVVINQAESSINLTSNASSPQVLVANSGRYSVLVSDQNGPIAVGDYITLSQLNGIGMKAGTTQPIVVGQALTSFSGKGITQGTDTIGNGGAKQTVQLGEVTANISIAKNPLEKLPTQTIPKVLKQYSTDIAGKTVNAWKIFLSVAVLIVVTIVFITMIASAVRNSVIGIGRNPLSGKVITKGFLELTLIAIIIFISGIFGIYLLLKL